MEVEGGVFNKSQRKEGLRFSVGKSALAFSWPNSAPPNSLQRTVAFHLYLVIIVQPLTN
jgi:hypothetical protein